MTVSIWVSLCKVKQMTPSKEGTGENLAIIMFESAFCDTYFPSVEPLSCQQQGSPAGFEIHGGPSNQHHLLQDEGSKQCFMFFFLRPMHSVRNGYQLFFKYDILSLLVHEIPT